jgi:hypothetical protein
MPPQPITWYATPPSPPPPMVNSLPPYPRLEDMLLCMYSSHRRVMSAHEAGWVHVVGIVRAGWVGRARGVVQARAAKAGAARASASARTLTLLLGLLLLGGRRVGRGGRRMAGFTDLVGVVTVGRLAQQRPRRVVLDGILPRVAVALRLEVLVGLRVVASDGGRFLRGGGVERAPQPSMRATRPRGAVCAARPGATERRRPHHGAQTRPPHRPQVETMDL